MKQPVISCNVLLLKDSFKIMVGSYRVVICWDAKHGLPMQVLDVASVSLKRSSDSSENAWPASLGRSSNPRPDGFWFVYNPSDSEEFLSALALVLNLMR